jgi:hypothetical protein
MLDNDLGESLYKTSSDAMAYSYVPDPSDSDWYVSAINARISAYYEHSNFDPTDPQFTGVYAGETTVNYYEYMFPGGEEENGEATYIIEATVPRALLGADNPQDGELVGFRFAPGCRNDGNSNTGVIALFGTVDDNEKTDLELTKEVIPTKYRTKWTIPISKGEQWAGGDYWLRMEYDMPSFDVWGLGNLKADTTTIGKDWHHLVGRYTTGENIFGEHKSEILLDGQKVASRLDNGTQEPTDSPLLFGSYLKDSFFYAGCMDEIRLSSVARSDNWLASTAQMLKLSKSFVTTGAENAGSILNFEKNIEINTAIIQGAVSNFPIVVDISDAELATAVIGANEICFTLTDGTLLPSEIERYNNGQLIAWVKVPVLEQDVPAAISMHYGGPCTTSATDVWDTGFTLVQHFASESSTILDSTSFQNDTDNNGATYIPFGVVGSSYAFDGINDYMETLSNDSINFENSSFTVEGWFARDVIAADAIMKLTLYNNGDKPGLDVQVKDYLTTDGLTVVANYATDGSFNIGTEIWTVDELQPGQSATLWLAVNVDGTDSVISTAEIVAMYGEDLDSVANNFNTAEDDQASVTIVPCVTPYDPANPGQKPDFYPTSIKFLPENPVVGQEFIAYIKVENRGDISSKPGKISVWLDQPVNVDIGTVGEYNIIPDKEINQDSSNTFVIRNMQVPAGFGEYQFRIYVDSDNEYAEYGGQYKSQLVKAIKCNRDSTGKPDLKVTSVSMPKNLAPNEDFTALITVANIGDFDAAPNEVSFYLSETNNAIVGDLGDFSTHITSVIKHGESKRITVNMTAPSTNGFYLFRAFADSENAVEESSEGNNQGNFLYVVRDPAPDFIVKGITFSEEPTIGQPFTSYVEVENIGNAAGIPHYVDVAIVGTSNSQWTSVDDVLEPGDSIIVPVDSITPGSDDFMIKATVDSLEQTEELDEDNNTKIYL